MSTKKSDHDLLEEAYTKGRAKHFLNNLLIPMIRKEAKKPPTDDVASGGDTQYLVTALIGAEKHDARAAKTRKFNVN